MMLLFSCDEVIELLKLILINENFNNQVVKTGCRCIYMRTDLSENRVRLNFFWVA